MIIVDRALERREREGNPIRVGLVGAGFMGRGIALQIVTAAQGMELVAVANRNLEPALQAYADAGVDDPQHVETVAELEAGDRRRPPGRDRRRAARSPRPKGSTRSWR